MMFWIRNILFLIILLALGYYLIANQETLFAEKVEVEQTAEEILAEKEDEEQVIHSNDKAPSFTKEPKNAAAAGLSKFYANLRGTDEDDGPRVRNNVVYLPPPSGDLVQILEAKRLVTRPLRRNWQSARENLAFRVGFTLNQKLTEYAENNGLEVFWWIDKDFLIKDPFRINKDIIQAAYQITKGVEGHFQDGLKAYFCYRHRSLVVVQEDFEYLDEQCQLLDGSKRR